MKLPVYDAHGASLISFARLDGVLPQGDDAPPACSMIVVRWEHQVLFGFNVTRQQFELPGGSIELHESPLDAATRELAEETGIDTTQLFHVAHAVCSVARTTTTYVAEVFATLLDTEPVLVESDELHSFVWWDPTGDEWEGQSRIDAEIARRSRPLGPLDVS